jgi:hypothetical protein
MENASTPSGRALADYSATVRQAQAGKIRELLPRGLVDQSDVGKDEWVTHFLDAYGISTHPMDLAMFRAGFSLGQNGTELPRRLAWDVDEVQLHWSLNPADMFRGLFRGRHDVPFQNTPRELFDYLPFEPSPEVSLNWPLRFWYHGVQRLAPSRMRQTIQFHPGGRALLLGIQSSAYRPLNLVTTGPAGRLLVLVNEDPALKQIFFGKVPTETVTIEEIRNASNIYTREDLVNALRILEQGEVELLRDPLVQDYIKKIKTYPKQVEKLKHPALAKILQKNSFNILVDDSDATYRMLGDIPGFIVLKPPSARPKAMLNMALGSRRLHLDRMANGSFEELARILASEQGGRSREIPVGNLSGDYPLQRFVLELPWARYRHEYALPGAELEFLSGKIAGTVLPEPMQYPNQTYLMGDNGYSFREPGRRVVVLGDGSGDRTYQLAKAGHYPTVIDWDSEALPMFQRAFRRANQLEIRQGKFNREVLAQWINSDWYRTRADAHAVEVFYPFSVVPFIGASEQVTTQYVRQFMEGALHSKLRPEGGSVYLVTEVLPLVERMEAIVRQDPSLELIDMELYEHHRPPIRGGHGSTMELSKEETSWILYVKKPR